MESHNFFIDWNGHLRSGWRLAIFCIAFLICVQVTIDSDVRARGGASRPMMQVGDGLSASLRDTAPFDLFFDSRMELRCTGEEMPFAKFSCSPHRGWLRNFLVGSLLGAASLFFLRRR
jgi:hypothetical protein